MPPLPAFKRPLVRSNGAVKNCVRLKMIAERPAGVRLQ
eukprot:SAG31_NODE_41153_length_277_cov_0.870787_1_plen_37_part_10